MLFSAASTLARMICSETVESAHENVLISELDEHIRQFQAAAFRFPALRYPAPGRETPPRVAAPYANRVPRQHRRR